ncbi:MAG: DUF4340 domain-containing protein [bacterium]
MSYLGRVVVLAVVNALLLVTLVVGAVVTRGPHPLDEPLLAAEPADVGRVSFVSRDFSIERGASGWELSLDGEAYPARDDRVGELLDELAGARIVRRVADDPAVFEELGVADDQGSLVSVEAGGAESRFVFGDEEPDGIYVRRGASQSVWLARGALGFYLEQGAPYWALLRLFPESARPADAIRVSVESRVEDYDITLEPGPDGERWVVAAAGDASAAVAEGSRVRHDRAGSLVRTAVDLVGSGFYDGGAWDELPSVARVSFVLADGRSFRVEVRDDGDFLVARPQGPSLPGAPYDSLRYTIDPQVVRQLTPDLRTLVDDE